jgi:outer membrane biosynthesis protein TonB
MDRYPDELDKTGFELLEDRTRRIEVAHHGRRLGVSVPGALLGALLIATIAFGAAGAPGISSPAGEWTTATSIDTERDLGSTVGAEPKAEEPKAEDPKADEPKADEPMADEPKADEPKADEPKADEPKDDEPKADEPKDDPAESRDQAKLEIGLGLNDGKVVVEWTACEPDGFVAYKVVRSTDNTVTYPKAANDVLVGVVEQAATTRLVDGNAPAGRKLWYRVFAVAQPDGGAWIACASALGAITTPEPEPEPEPKPDPTPEPTPKPEVGALGLAVSIDEGHPWVDWTACEADGFEGYKVVRSKDSTVTFPAGDNDSVIAFVGADGKTAFFDKDAPAGRKLWYRVFCVDKTDGNYVVRAASAARAVTTPEAEPAPDPVTLGFELDVTEAGVVLHWQACTSDLFVYYKVVRSTKSNPSYLPGTDGSQVIAVVENRSATEWVDGPDAGTWYYRIQAIGYHGGSKVLLGQTEVLAVTID